jgi:outer membrane protein
MNTFRMIGSFRAAGRVLRGARRFTAGALTVMAWLATSPAAYSQSLEAALANAYVANPDLNAQRAAVRATDEGVPQALSGYRPRIQGTADATATYQDRTPNSLLAPDGTTVPRGVGVTAQQTLYNGQRTANQVRQAETVVLGARENLRNTEQNVLLDAVTAYMDVLRDSAILDLRRRNVEVIEEQLRATRDRFNVGEVTRTDVAQAEARLALAQSEMSGAQSVLSASRATFRRVIGMDPGKLSAARSAERFLPKALDAAIAAGLGQHPAINAAMHGYDAASLQVKVAESALYPVLTLNAGVQRRWDQGSTTGNSTLQATIGTQLVVPIYQGGAEYSTIRQSKETAGQRRIEIDGTRDRVRAAVVQSWGQLSGARAQIEAAQAQVNAAEIALNGVREEARVGQRTTLDVLNAQQELVNARVNLVSAQRNRVVTSFSLLSATGRLSIATLGIKAPAYDPQVHYDQVRDKWIGVRTPDGR